MKFIEQFNLVELAKKEPASAFPQSSAPGSFKRWLRGGFSFLLILIVVLLLITLGYQRVYANKVLPGVSLGTLKICGMTSDQLRNIIKPMVDKVENQGLLFRANSDLGQKDIVIKSVLIALSDPDLSRRVMTLDLDATVHRAMMVGREGSLFNQIGQTFQARANGYPLSAVFQMDEQEIKNNLQDNLKSVEQEPHDAGFILQKNGDLKIIKDQGGYFFDVDGAIRQAKQNFSQLVFEPIDLRSIYYEPKIKVADVQNMEPKILAVLNLSPVTLQHQDQAWKVNKNLLSQWLLLNRDTSNIVQLTLGSDEIALYLNQISKKINQPAVDAKFRIDGDRVIEFRPSQTGQTLNVDQSIQTIIQNVLSGNSQIDLVVDAVVPQVLTQDVNNLGIKELIGRGISNFAGSPVNRRHNIAVGAKILNGLLIKPGEEFSLIKALGEIDAKAGFLPELVIKGDRTVPEFGGGLCQIGTTTFRVALYSGLPITARTPHSYRVVYYEPAGMDATIYQPQPDLRFINDSGANILFETRVDGNNLIFEFYGTSDGRKVEVTQPALSNVTPPGPPLEVKTLELAPGVRRKLESAHAGADAEFSRTITYADGSQKTNVWKSHYRPWQEVWMVGVASLDEVTSSTPSQLQQP